MKNREKKQYCVNGSYTVEAALVSVSYTHLDVYKRQVLPCILLLFLGALGYLISMCRGGGAK